MKITAITIAVLRFDPDLATKLARRRGGIDVVSDGRVAFRMSIPSTPLRDPCTGCSPCGR